MHFLRLLATTSVPWLASAAPELYSRVTTITIDTSKTYQTIDGFGFSKALQRAKIIVGLPPDKQKNVLDILFDTTTSTGFSILRIGIGSPTDLTSDHMNMIEPKNLGGPTMIPNYVWDGTDSGQVFVAQQAVAYGVKSSYGSAWTAPAFVKTNNNVNNGGYLCGVTGEKRASGDWRQAYANYLIAWTKFYAGIGVSLIWGS
jgi:O-glycosyl hydrolase